MIRINAATVLAIMCAAGAPAAAQAQRYYARERLVAASQQTPSYTYAPVYGAYGSCSGGTKKAAIKGCTRSDGESVATSLCSASPATKSVKCFTCSIEQGRTASFGAYNSTTTSSAAGAVTICENIANGGAGAGACLWNSTSKEMQFGSDSNNGRTIPTTGTSAQYGGRCEATP